LVIFDRYTRRGVLAPAYLANVADYVRKGGATLIAAGPNFGGPTLSLPTYHKRRKSLNGDAGRALSTSHPALAIR